MTALSCVAVGIAFVIAVALLVLAGALIGWALPIGRRLPDPPEATPEKAEPEPDGR